MALVGRLGRAGSAVALATVITLVTGATPAAATVTSGAGTGLYTFKSEFSPPCGSFKEMRWTSLAYVAEYSVVAGDVEYAYQGPVEIRMRSTESFWGNATGDFSDPTCTTPDAVDVVSTVKSALDDRRFGGVRCSYQGTWDRGGLNGVQTATMLSGSCNITNPSSAGGGSSGRQPSTELRSGVMGVCARSNDPPLIGPPQTCQSTEESTEQP